MPGPGLPRNLRRRRVAHLQGGRHEAILRHSVVQVQAPLNLGGGMGLRGQHSTMAHFLLDPAAPGLIPSIPEIFQRKTIIDIADVN